MQEGISASGHPLDVPHLMEQGLSSEDKSRPAVQKCYTVYVTLRSITLLTTAHHWSIYWTR